MNKDKIVSDLRAMIEYHKAQVVEYTESADWWDKNGADVEGLSVNHYGSFVNIRTPTRDDLMRVLKTFQGKWRKSVNSEKPDTLDYTLYGENGAPTINAVSAPPPPSCQIVEELVDIPAQPARQEIRKVVKCTTDVAAAPDEIEKMSAL